MERCGSRGDTLGRGAARVVIHWGEARSSMTSNSPSDSLALLVLLVLLVVSLD